MPVDPTVALHVTGPGTGLDDPGKGTAVSPLGQAQNFADTMGKLNAVKQFNQEFQAKQELGQIMANSPDLPTALDTIRKNPKVAGFLPEVITNLSSANRINQESLSIGQKRRQDAFGAGASVLQGMLVDPDSAERNLPAILGNIPDPTDRDFAEKNVRTLIKGINDGLEKFDDTPGANGEPSPRKQEMAKRILAVGYQTGSQDALTKQLPQPGTVTGRDKAGNATTQPVTIAPATPTIISTPGTIKNAGNSIAMGLQPQVAPDKGVRTDATGGGGGGRGNDASAAGAPVVSGLGTPLFDKTTVMKPPPSPVRTIAGAPAGPEGDRNDALVKAHNGEDLNRFKSTQDTEAQLADVSHDVESLAKNGGFLTPGSGGDIRLGISKFAKMFEDVTGTKLGIDSSKIANAEDLMKATNRMTLDFLNSKLGNQREAAETIRNMTDKGMPGINNTLLGSRLMIGMIGALNQRTKDGWRWDDEWAGRNNGDMRGSAGAFDEKYNAKKYINKALADLGMNEHGFTSKAALQKALDSGLLTMEQAKAIQSNNGRIPDDLPAAEPK